MKYVTALTLLVIALLAYFSVVLEVTNPPIKQLHKEYTHFKLYEDGSYEAQRWDGMNEVGCLKGALCND